MVQKYNFFLIIKGGLEADAIWRRVRLPEVGGMVRFVNQQKRAEMKPPLLPH
jgi:hypothetical protein